jgi:hypothetical protein
VSAGESWNCAPDLALGPNGEALVSSNVVPTLWRIDPATLTASRHELVLEEDRGRDIGFTGLVYSPVQGAFFAVSALHGSMWRIDPLLKRAQGIPLSAPIPKACGLVLPVRTLERKAGRNIELCVRAERGDWTVSLAPDHRSGYVRAGQCESE